MIILRIIIVSKISSAHFIPIVLYKTNGNNPLSTFKKSEISIASCKPFLAASCAISDDAASMVSIAAGPPISPTSPIVAPTSAPRVVTVVAPLFSKAANISPILSNNCANCVQTKDESKRGSPRRDIYIMMRVRGYHLRFELNDCRRFPTFCQRLQKFMKKSGYERVCG